LRTAAWAGLATLGVAGGVIGAGLLFADRTGEGFGSTVDAGSLDTIGPNSVRRFELGRFWLSRYKEPALGNREVLLALYWKCAHLGCTVNWNANFLYKGERGLFQCPCHGSVYNRAGQHVGGPAPRPLDIMEIRLDSGRIWVETGRVSQRVQYDPQQATLIT
jgi:cytochrome b6-f complex iron-sulfur subunit